MKLRHGVAPSPNARNFKTFTSGAATNRVDYSHDLFAQEALDWVRRLSERGKPFFLCLYFTAPHANNEGTRMTGDGAEVPDYGIYAEKDWPKQDKGQAAMITRMDHEVGRLLDLLMELRMGKIRSWFLIRATVRTMKRDIIRSGLIAVVRLRG